MEKDFAKPSRNAIKSPLQNGFITSAPVKTKHLPWWLILFAGLSVGCFVSFLVYLYSNRSLPNNSYHSYQQSQAFKQTKAAAKQKIASTVDKAKFEFYNLLPNEEVNNVRANNPVKANKIVTDLTPKSEDSQFFVRVSTFDKFNQADSLKASMALLGIDSKINTSTLSDESKFSVYLGPYSNLKSALAQQRLLSANSLTSNIVTDLSEQQ